MSQRVSHRVRRGAGGEHEEPAVGGAPAKELPACSSQQQPPARILQLFETLQDRQFGLVEQLQAVVQEVKGHLYNRDYLAAFDSEAKRTAYFTRWLSLRALAYALLFGSLAPVVEALRAHVASDDAGSFNCMLVGGGAGAELVGLAAVYSRLKELRSTADRVVRLEAVDVSDWSSTVAGIGQWLEEESGWFYQQGQAEVRFVHGDVLQATPSLPDVAAQQLITLMFTTNELFAQSKAGAIRFLQSLGRCAPGTLLLVAELAGLFSHITVGTKRFPVHFLVDKVLGDGGWRVQSQLDSCWYRVDSELQQRWDQATGIKLENMRFFYRMYQKQ